METRELTPGEMARRSGVAVSALHFYEREGLIRETILTDGVYENLVILGILDREFFARREQGLEKIC